MKASVSYLHAHSMSGGKRMRIRDLNRVEQINRICMTYNLPHVIHVGIASGCYVFALYIHLASI